MIKETKSNWDCVANLMKDHPEIIFGKNTSYWIRKMPHLLLCSFSYYKFAAKLIGKEKRVLDVGCNEGLGAWLLSKECGFAKGIDLDQEGIQTARSNFPHSQIEFSVADILKEPSIGTWDAVVNFDIVDHFYRDKEEQLMEALKGQVTTNGLVIMGIPRIVTQNALSRDTSVNHYSPEKFERILRQNFEYIFLFAANDEVIHTGNLSLAQYLIGIGSKKK